jgi:hypothetical protein
MKRLAFFLLLAPSLFSLGCRPSTHMAHTDVKESADAQRLCERLRKRRLDDPVDVEAFAGTPIDAGAPIDKKFIIHGGCNSHCPPPPAPQNTL